MPLSVQKLLSRLSLRQLEVFQAVYTTGGYGKAADLLGLTQPAVSSQIRQLESALGQKLFEYIGRTLYCTAVGEMVEESVAVIFEELRRLQNDIHALEGQISGDLKVAAVSTAQYVIPYVMKPFLADYPEVNMSVQVVNRAAAIERLNQNTDDVLIMGIVPTDRPVSSVPFLDNELIPVVPADHPLAGRDDVSPQEFLQQGFLARERGSGSRLALEQHCLHQRLRLEPSMEVGSNESLKHAVIAGLGVAILPRLSVLSELKLGSLKTLPLEGFPLRRSWCLVYPTAKSHSPVTRRFIEYVQGNLAGIDHQFRRMVAEHG
ncbi:LysR family transcriptional regulator [Saccharospirillum salsuginis]|uniref:Transcriptional regulator n=1 Tax=Saccharospirillum salsuginis TaxID=418750 RepID=A0A918K244_9GAMM|nr:LysR family transcriptional regulator [Saccharospirillum salsuginis]GGX43147.1 transcriptional regulator [Saccharospirillum salsuginis]